MDFDAMINKLSFKKVVIVAGASLFVFWLIRSVMMLSALYAFGEMFSQFNTNFDQSQKGIHDKIAESDRSFDRRAHEFDESNRKFSELFAESRKSFNETFKQIDRERTERERKFNKSFAEAPDRMFAQHDAMTKRMFDDFEKGKKAHQQFFKSKVLNVDKQLEGTRCGIELGSRPEKMKPNSMGNLINTEELYAYFMKLRNEQAKRIHCEAYV